MAQINSVSSQRSSQRILKVVNIIGSKNTDEEGQLSSKRISVIRARQYKSKGEKVTFRHTPSRERLLTSQELALASGFQHVQLGPAEMMHHYPMNISSHNGRLSHLSENIVKKKKSRGARKNRLLLSNQGGTAQKAGMQANSFAYQQSTYSNNLNKLLDEIDK